MFPPTTIPPASAATRHGHGHGQSVGPSELRMLQTLTSPSREATYDRLVLWCSVRMRAAARAGRSGCILELPGVLPGRPLLHDVGQSTDEVAARLRAAGNRVTALEPGRLAVFW